MRCEDYRDAIVDLARAGGEANCPASVVEHLAQCAPCAQRLAQQRAVSAGLRLLAAANADAAPSDQLEQRLLATFDAEHSGNVAHAAVPAFRRARIALSRMRGAQLWMRAAAVIVLAGGTALAWWVLGVPRTVSQSPLMVRTTRPPAVESPRPTATRVVAVTPVQPAPPASPPATKPASAKLVTAEGFVALPGADSLPDFESGEIVRTEVPVAALPLYGLPIAPDAGGGPVAADLLVGQDGRPRAIRLVTPGYSTLIRTQTNLE